MTIEFCKYCNGTGKIHILVNYTEYHYNAEEPIIGEESCEYCGFVCEDELPEEMSTEDYNEWYKKSEIILGVRRGPEVKIKK